MHRALHATILAIMSACRDMTVATLAADGAPQATVVSFVHDGLLLYFGCGARSQKAANLARDARVSVAMTAPYRSWEEIQGLSITAVAQPVTAPGEAVTVGELMLRRFPQIVDFEAADPGSVTLFRLRPQVISVLDYTKGFGHTDLVRVGGDEVEATLDSMRHRWLVPADPEA